MKNFTFKIYLVFSLALILTLNSHAQSTANYDISVTTIWNAGQHSSVPPNAHWSNLIGATHNSADEFVSLGSNATLGIKDVAERGDNVEFIIEVNDAISNGDANQLLQDGFSPFAGDDSMAGFIGITVSEDFPLITLVSMVAPSPDWFIAINSLTLRSGNPGVNNGWKDTFTMDVFAYDAGTDDATDYVHTNTPSAPPVPVSMITGFPVNGNRMATITFTYNSSTLSTENFDDLSDIRVFPIPADHQINITQGTHLIKSIEIFNLLGKRVQTISNVSSESRLQINTTDLSSGIYLLKLTDINDASLTKKIVIQ